MSFRFLMVLGCCFIYSTTASASVTFIAGDGDQSFSSKSFTTQSISCPEGTVLYNGKCEETCEDYPLTQIDPKKGEYIERTCRDVKYYRYTSCHNGWEAESTNSPNTEAPNAREKIGGIHDGPILSPSDPLRDDGFNPARDGGSHLRAMSAVSAGNSKINQGNNKSKQNIIKDCVIPADCANYYSDRLSSTAGVVIEKKCGEEIKYRYSKCHVGWSPRVPKDGISCNRTTCSLSAYPYEGGDYGHIRTTLENCPTGQTCNDTTEDNKGEIRVCFSGNDTHWGYTKCNEGWLGDNDSTTPVNGDCTESACNGYPYNSSNIPHCEKTDPCKKGLGTAYRCTKASDGYTIDNEGSSNAGSIIPNDHSNFKQKCTDECTISGGKVTGITGCKNKEFTYIRSGEDYYYTCTKPDTGYYLDDGKPKENSCSGYGAPDSSIANCKEGQVEGCDKGSQKVWKCTKCENCYQEAENGTCDRAIQKYCPYYNNNNKGNQVIGIVFDAETRLIMGLKNKGSTSGGVNKVSKWGLRLCTQQQFDDIYKSYAGDSLDNKVLNSAFQAANAACYGDVPGIQNFDSKIPNEAESEYLRDHEQDCQGLVGKAYVACDNARREDAYAAARNKWQEFLDEDDDGKSNTDKIVAYAQQVNKQHEAAQLCHDETLDGQQWFLPTIGQWVKGLEGITVSADITLNYSVFKNFHKYSLKYGGDDLNKKASGSGNEFYFWTSSEAKEPGYAYVINMNGCADDGCRDQRVYLLQSRKDSNSRNEAGRGAYLYRTRCFFTAP